MSAPVWRMVATTLSKETEAPAGSVQREQEAAAFDSSAILAIDA